ncbi:MAG: ROK family protein [Candidatus Sericytochromatia bacterium]
MSNYSIGIDIGGTKLSFGIINDKGEVVYETRETSARLDAKDIIEKLLETTEKVLEKAKSDNITIKGIGIGSPGRIDGKAGLVVDCSPNMKNWKGVNLKKLFEDKFNLPVLVDNDANCAAFGEYFLFEKEGKEDKTILVLTLGTGLGSGVITNNRVFKGKGLGCEIGHMILDYNGRKCNCGQTGCIEAYVSGTALETQAKERLYKYPDSKLNNETEITGYTIFKNAKEGDIFCNILIDEMGEFLAYGIISLVNIFDPDMVLLSGGISLQKEFYFNKLRKIVKDRINYSNFDLETIQIAQSNDKAGLIGAGLIALQ